MSRMGIFRYLGISFGLALLLFLIKEPVTRLTIDAIPSLHSRSHENQLLLNEKADPSNSNLLSMQELLEKQPLQQLEMLLTANPHPEMDDPQLVNIIRRLLHHPPRTGMVKLSHHLKSTKQADVVFDILNKTKGFFVECGGLDGERSSNTLFLEQKKKWTGLLVEMDPLFFMQLVGKNRRCHALHACLSPTIYPSKLGFRESSLGSGKLTTGSGKQVTCLPMFSVMQAMGQKVIDYFSLDVEGQELNVLQTIPFDKLDIRVLSVEYVHVKGDGVTELTNFMSKHGYLMYKKIDFVDGKNTMYTHDLIFVKKELV